MSQLPSDPAEPHYVAYPRGVELRGSADQVRLLAEGYTDLNRAILVGMAVQLVVWMLVCGTGWLYGEFIFAAGMTINAWIVARLSYVGTRKVGLALDWRPTTPAVVSIVLGLQSWLLFGAPGFLAIQGQVATAMKKYGLKLGFRGFRKEEIDRVIRQLEALEAAPPIASAPYYDQSRQA